jgi:hypothetical protein
MENLEWKTIVVFSLPYLITFLITSLHIRQVNRALRDVLRDSESFKIEHEKG